MMHEHHRDAPNAIVLGGRTGLLGQALCVALRARGWAVHAPGRGDMDIFDPRAVARVIHQTKARALYNTVAYTQVDKAEDEPDAAMRLNRDLPLALGQAVARTDALLVHYSTDFVFDGAKGAPYVEDDAPAPQSVYGRTKLAGEQALLALDLSRLLLLRTSWLFGPGKINFVTRILELAASRPELSVVQDQIGSPSYTVDLAANTMVLVDAGVTGLFHLAGAGQASWFDLAAEAVRLRGLACQVRPIASAHYPQKARRPAYSVLDLGKFTAATGFSPRPWKQALHTFLDREGT